MDAPVRQSQLDVVQDAVEERLRLSRFQLDIAETRRGFIKVADIFHQNGVADLRERPWNIGPVVVEQALRLVFVVDPGSDLRGAPALAFARGGAAPAAVAMLCLPLFVALYAAVAIDGVVAQSAENARAIDFRRQVLHPRRRMGRTAIHGGLLPAVRLVQNIGNQMLVVKGRQRRENPGRIAPGCQQGGIEGGFVALAALTGKLLLVFIALLAQPALHIAAGLVAGLARRPGMSKRADSGPLALAGLHFHEGDGFLLVVFFVASLVAFLARFLEVFLVVIFKRSLQSRCSLWLC